MSDNAVLYDAPGPRARRRSRISALVAVVALLVLIGLVAKRLADQGQFSAELWGPVLNPSTPEFPQVWNLLGQGLVATIKAAALSIVLSLVLGTVIGVGRMMLGRWSRLPLIGVIELLRGLPVVVSIYFASRVLPQLGVNLNVLPGGEQLWFVVIGLTAYNSVIIAEIIRAGVASLPRGQREAALAVGLTSGQTMRAVLLPQAFRVMLPALISQVVVIVKDTSLAAVLGIYPELLKEGNLIAQNLSNPIQMLTVVGIIFVIINFSLSRLAVWVERRLSRRSTGAAADEIGLEAQMGQA
jgi:glutamate transport system permease protein